MTGPYAQSHREWQAILVSAYPGAEVLAVDWIDR